MKYIELFERKIIREPKLIGDFIFDMFFQGDTLVPSIKEYEPGMAYYIDNFTKKKDNNNYYVIIDCQHVYNKNITIETLDKFKNILEQLQTICAKGTKSEPGLVFEMSYGRIHYKLKIPKEKAEEILQSPEHAKWIDDNKEKYKKYKDEVDLKKSMKKYNL